MSDNVYPELPGLKPTQARIIVPPPVEIRTTPSLREYRARSSALPRYRYRLSYEVLRATSALAELQQLAAFFNIQGGPFDSFLFRDAIDYTVTNASFGTGTGSATVFALARNFGGHGETVPQIGKVGTITNIKVNGSVTGAYTQSGGFITFSSAPSSGATLTWTGTYYRRVRFESREMNLERVMGALWKGDAIELMSVKG